MGDQDLWVEPSAASTLAFLAVCGLVLALFVWGVGRAYGSKRAAIIAAVAAAGWVAITGGYVALGLSARGAPGLMVFFMGANLAGVALAFSPVGTKLIGGLPLWTLAAFQGFRLPLELVLHDWSRQGTMPIQMTFEGHNFDIVTGVLGVGVAAVVLLGRKQIPRSALMVINAIGSALLIAVIVIVLLSSPLPIKSYAGPPILLGLYLPYAWIGPVLVAGAMSAHVMSWRGLLRGASTTS